MNEKLMEMSLEELWKLFPIFLIPYQPYWKDWYIDEKEFLKVQIPEAVRISHIGSTAIGFIWAKPIIDILIEVPENINLYNIKNRLIQQNYLCMNQSKNRISLNKGYTENGFAKKVFHLHIRYLGDNDELYFRDYLMEHQDIAAAYETTKIKLWNKYEYNRDEYTRQKTEFVRKYTEEAKLIYGKRY